MIKPIEAASHPDAQLERQRAQADKAFPSPVREARQRAEPQPNVRLTVDKSQDGLFYVYTLTDRDTGRIISQLPRSEAAGGVEQPDYRTGTVLNTKA